MLRFYLALALLLAAALEARAQSKPSQERPPLGSTITVDALGELPASATIYALLETAVPDIIADRLDTGGLSAGDPARVGAHGSTWTQTLIRLGDADITDPNGGGTPLLSPGVAEWDRVDVSTGIMPVDASAPGLSISLVPRSPFDVWQGRLDLFGSLPFLNAAGPRATPSIKRLNNWAHANLFAGGPAIADRLGAFLSATWTRSSHFERTGAAPLDANLASVFVHLLATPDPSDQVRFIGWAQRTREPLANHAAIAQPTAAERDAALHVQAAWQRLTQEGKGGVRGFGSYTVRGRNTEIQRVPFVVIERLRDGPVPALLDPGDGTDSVWDVGGRFHGDVETEASGHHTIVAGVDLSGSSTSMQSAFTGRVGERINGLPARVWDLADPAAPSLWRQTMFTAYASDTFAVTRRLTLNLGARLELVQGYASDAASTPAISWNNWYPRGGLHVALTNFWEIAAFGQFGRYGHRLPLRYLAYGDDTAPTGNVYRWTGGSLAPSAPLGPIVQRIGPGSGGRLNFSAIDPKLRRPYMDEFVFGFESRPHPTTFARMAAIARREQPLIGVVDVGVPESTYSTIGVRDPGIDLMKPADQILLFYNRSPVTFGADRYLLTNPPDHVATFVGVDVTAEARAKHLFVIAGATAGRSEGISANRGFGPLENDAAVLGEVFINPNARGHAQGRLFTERGYTIKTALAYQFDYDFTAGLIGRYEDGQHFARMVVVQNLNQGTEAVRAFRNGRTRFTYSMTIDARLQKAFSVGAHRITAVVDAYNLFNQALEVEEFQVTGAGARLTSAVQPPRVLHVGLRIAF